MGLPLSARDQIPRQSQSRSRLDSDDNDNKDGSDGDGDGDGVAEADEAWEIAVPSPEGDSSSSSTTRFARPVILVDCGPHASVKLLTSATTGQSDNEDGGGGGDGGDSSKDQTFVTGGSGGGDGGGGDDGGGGGGGGNGGNGERMLAAGEVALPTRRDVIVNLVRKMIVDNKGSWAEFGIIALGVDRSYPAFHRDDNGGGGDGGDGGGGGGGGRGGGGGATGTDRGVNRVEGFDTGYGLAWRNSPTPLKSLSVSEGNDVIDEAVAWLLHLPLGNRASGGASNAGGRAGGGGGGVAKGPGPLLYAEAVRHWSGGNGGADSVIFCGSGGLPQTVCMNLAALAAETRTRAGRIRAAGISVVDAIIPLVTFVADDFGSGGSVLRANREIEKVRSESGEFDKDDATLSAVLAELAAASGGAFSSLVPDDVQMMARWLLGQW